MGAWGGLAHADDAVHAPVFALYTQECGSCHMAFPPGLLPAASWTKIMGGLDKHYGSDASLDAATVQQINGWLQTHAGTYKRVNEEPPQDRITRSAWFERKHRKIDPAVWTLPSVKSAANCAACHTAADRGVFDDDNLKYPAGMDARMRRGFSD
jgi:mono/diheme cytochrome c family protein